MKNFVAVVLCLVSVCAMADNQRGFYVGVGMAEFLYDDEVIDPGNSRSAELIGGYKYNGALGVEIRYGTGIAESKGNTYVDPANITAELPGRFTRELDSYYAVYYKPELINDEAKLYLLLGYMDIDSSETILAQDGSTVSQVNLSESGASYGIGVGFILPHNFNFNVEYRTLPKQNGVETEVVSANFDYRF